MNSDGALLITVNFKQTDCTLRFLKSTFLLERLSESHVVIVDNNSGDGSVTCIQDAIRGRDNVELAASARNRGYFGGARWALDRYLVSHPLPPWVIVCNNDIVFDEPKFLETLVKTDPTTVGMLAPSIVSRLTGHDANPSIENRPGAFRIWQYRLWFSNYCAMWVKQWLWPFVRKARKKVRRPRPVLRSHPRTQIYAPHGAFLIFSRQFFEAGGFIDDGSFLYGEEFLVAEMCRQLRLPVVHDQALRVWHAEGRTLGRMLTREMFGHQRSGFRYAMYRYRNGYPELAPPGSSVQAQATPEPGTARSLPAVGGNVR